MNFFCCRTDINIEKFCNNHTSKSSKNEYDTTESLENYENINIISNSTIKIEKAKGIEMYNEHENNLVSSYITDNTFFEVDCIEPQKETERIAEEEIVLKLEDIENNKDGPNIENIINFDVNVQTSLSGKQCKNKKKEAIVAKANKKQKTISKTDKIKKKIEIDIRKAPEFNIQLTCKEEANDLKEIVNDVKLETNNLENTNKTDVCINCGVKHGQNECLLYLPYYLINDSITHEEWIRKYKNNAMNFDREQNNTHTCNDIKHTFAYLSLPKGLYLEETNTPHGLGVFSKEDLKEFTQMGPLTGPTIKEVDIPEECNMRDLWEIVSTEKTHIYINTADLSESNWIRFVRPAPVREMRNISAISKDNHLFLITIKVIRGGEELLYWQDDVVTFNKKKLEKTSK